MTALSDDFSGEPIPLFLPLSRVCEPITAHISSCDLKWLFLVFFLPDKVTSDGP